MIPVKVVISLSARPVSEPAIGYSAFSICSTVMVREPASAIIDAVSAASPSLPAGSCADPTLKSSLKLSWGSTDFCWTIGTSGPLPFAAGTGAAAGAGAGAASGAAGFSAESDGGAPMSAASAALDNVVTTSPASVK